MLKCRIYPLFYPSIKSLSFLHLICLWEQAGGGLGGGNTQHVGDKAGADQANISKTQITAFDGKVIANKFFQDLLKACLLAL